MPFSDVDAADATLELTIFLHSAGGSNRLRGSSSFLLLPSSKPKIFAVAWIDPTAKRSTKSLSLKGPSPDLHLPLSPRVLRDAQSTLTVQIFSSRFPFGRGGANARLEGAAVVPLSSLPAAAGKTLTFPLIRSSRRSEGFFRISTRVLWSLGASPQAASQAECYDWLPEHFAMAPATSGELGFYRIEPNAPPISEEYGRQPPNYPSEETAASLPSFMARPDTLPMQEENDGNLHLPPSENQPKHGGFARAWRSFWVGLASGSVAVALIGATAFYEG
ncbi:hypothetical protein ZIOFF_062106 [Zingiber officinale]|uniref:Uncharacterized protein n=1 Tax=Zingiber officinale TaxID=94328 RepID=A0A8J5KE72_ZINOF|nr:hypothetical protein ZIOFF_062106 [Zingiber officinale]